jgi:hypothetical protein
MRGFTARLRQNADRGNGVFCRDHRAPAAPPIREAHIYRRSTAVLGTTPAVRTIEWKLRTRLA